MPAKAAPKKSKSAIKRARKSEKLSSINRSVKSTIKTSSRKVEAEVVSKNSEKAKTALNEAISVIDKASAIGVIHENTASRKISRLTKLVNSLLLPGAA